LRVENLWCRAQEIGVQGSGFRVQSWELSSATDPSDWVFWKKMFAGIARNYDGQDDALHGLQVYLAHKKQPPPPI
jgi:hypothetical protein